MIYKNKTHSIPTIEKFIGLLKAYHVDMILCGSEAGYIYGLCNSIKDIDFILNDEINNKKRMFSMLKNFFCITSFDEFQEIHQIRIITLDKKQIEFFTHAEKNIIGISDNFESLKNRSLTVEFYNNDINIVSIEDYINIIQNYKNYLESLNLDRYTEKIKKYNNIINSHKLLDNQLIKENNEA